MVQAKSETKSEPEKKVSEPVRELTVLESALGFESRASSFVTKSFLRCRTGLCVAGFCRVAV
jgi:hypothetical protein